MRIKQLSVFVENQPGRLMEILKVLDENRINLQALLISDTAEYCIVRMVLDKPEKASGALKQAGFTTREDWLLRVEVPNNPGGLLHSVLQPLAQAAIYPKYFYGYTVPPTDEATILLKTDDLTSAERILKLV